MNLRLVAQGLIAILFVSGCAITPDTITQQTPSRSATQANGTHSDGVKRPQRAEPPRNNGAIYQAATYNPFFENRRARNLGDNLVIVINENTSAAKQGNIQGSASGSASFPAPTVFNKTFNKFITSAQAENEYASTNANSAKNNFAGTIAVTVIEILPNSNLLVSGEKQVAMDKGVEFIRFSGVVNPKDIAPGNTVSSTLVADARVEYRTNTRFDAADVMSTLGRLFLSVIPF